MRRKAKKKPERIVLGVGFVWWAKGPRVAVCLTADADGVKPVPLRWTKAMDDTGHRYRLVLERVEEHK